MLYYNPNKYVISTWIRNLANELHSDDEEKSLWKAAEILELVKLNFPKSRFTLRNLGLIYEYLQDSFVIVLSYFRPFAKIY